MSLHNESFGLRPMIATILLTTSLLHSIFKLLRCNVNVCVGCTELCLLFTSYMEGVQSCREKDMMANAQYCIRKNFLNCSVALEDHFLLNCSNFK